MIDAKKREFLKKRFYEIRDGQDGISQEDVFELFEILSILNSDCAEKGEK